MRLRPTCLLGLVAALAAAAAATPAGQLPGRIQVGFAGQARGTWNYLELWIYPNDNNECYARKTVGEVSALRWKLSFPALSGASFKAPAGSAAPAAAEQDGSLEGSEVRDYCGTDFAFTREDSQVPEDWSGTDSCNARLAVEAGGSYRVVSTKGDRATVEVRAPAFANPLGSGCKTNLPAGVLTGRATVSLRALAALPPGRTLTIRVGRDPGAINCSPGLVRYENYVTTRDCTTTLPWSGAVTFTKV